MSSTYNPDYWVIIKLTNKENKHNIHYRILAGWSGSYMYGSSWKISSGIKTFEDIGKSYKSLQSTGSVYMLSKNSERMNSIMQSQLNYQQEHSDYNVDVISSEEYIKSMNKPLLDELIQKDSQ